MPKDVYEPTLTPADSDESSEASAVKDRELGSYWRSQVDAALEREKDWRKEADRITGMFEAQKASADSERTPYNILYSNTETMSPALYNSTPVPVVKRRFDDADPLGKKAAEAGQRVLKYLVDDGMSESATFDELMASAVLEALVPGRGTTRFKYEAKTSEQPRTPPPAEGDTQLSATYTRVDAETVCGEEVPWDRFCHGYAKKWKDVPWVGFFHEMTKEELVEMFGNKGSLTTVDTAKVQLTDAWGQKSSQTHIAGMSVVKVAGVWELWDKASGNVIFVSHQFAAGTLKIVPDPLKLTGMFPCPQPLGFTQKISSLLPTPLYTFYEAQAKELNVITTRISKIVAALKVRGMYDTTIQGIDKVLEAADNILIPADNVAAMLQGQKLENAIWLFPIEKLVGVLQQLYLQRDQIKTVIYEITGIADIMRGSSQASETLGAQQLKTQWGGLRLKRSQKRVAAYARDCLRIMCEIAMTKLSPDTLQKMTGLPYPTQGQKQQGMQIAQSAAQSGQQPPPELLQLLQEPTWEDIQKLLANDISRSYRIDIETNSTIDAEATQDKQDIQEMLGAVAQFMQGVAPLIQSGSMPFELAQAMLLVVVRRFAFGPEIEDMLSQMKAPTPPPDPSAGKAQADTAAVQQQMQQDAQKHGMDMQAKQLDVQTKQQSAAATAQQTQMNMTAAQQAHEIAMAEGRMKAADLARKNEAAVLKHNLELSTMRAKAHADQQSAAAKAKNATKPVTRTA